MNVNSLYFKAKLISQLLGIHKECFDRILSGYPHQSKIQFIATHIGAKLGIEEFHQNIIVRTDDSSCFVIHAYLKKGVRLTFQFFHDTRDTNCSELNMDFKQWSTILSDACFTEFAEILDFR